MSYISIDGLASTKRLVLSLWFRVPQVSIKACRDAVGDASDPFDGIIPLVVMGKQGTKQSKTHQETETTDFVSTFPYVVGSAPTVTTIESISPSALGPLFLDVVILIEENPDASFAFGSLTQSENYQVTIDDGPGDKYAPSFIGVDAQNLSLVVNFETAQKPTVRNYSGYTVVNAGAPTTAGGDSGIFAYSTGTITKTGTAFVNPLNLVDFTQSGEITDVNFPIGSFQPRTTSFVDTSSFELDTTGAVGGNVGTIKPDRWHHVLVSLDLKTIATHGTTDFPVANVATNVDSASRLFIALDDVNYTKGALGGDWPSGSADPNAVISSEAFLVAVDVSAGDIPAATYTLSAPVLPLLKQPLGMPATADFAENIYMVEMGAMQLFTDVVLDPGQTKNRRLFIRAPDSNGVQKPASRAAAKKFFGRAADVSFFGTSQWKKAKVAVGRIDSYSPSPNLGGKQGT